MTTSSITRALLICGVVAGPLYMLVYLVQALTREGLDLTRHAASLLSNGDLGWIQVTSFLVTGLLVLAAAAGMRQALHPGPGGTWGPLLAGAYGIALIAAGIFTADPMDGFPPGTPLGPPAAMSSQALIHFVIASLGFLALIAACFVLARGFAARGQRGWATYSAASAAVFLASFVAIASGAGQRWATVAFVLGVTVAWAWLSATSARLATE